MKTIEVRISNARSLEHAMDQAIEQAESGLSTPENKFNTTHRVTSVKFKGLEVSIEYRDNHWQYIFEAELEEL